jgi:hypothetical protein
MKIVFIGDELGGAAFRLAGAGVRTPDGPLGEGELALLTPAIAARVAPRIRDAGGVVLVVPSADDADRPADFAAEVRRRLGISP